MKTVAKQLAPRGIIIGHSNMDLDCLGSIVLARYLYPDFLAIRSNRIHPLALTLFHMYQEHLALVGLAELDLSAIETVVVVDTRSLHQVQEVFDQLPDYSGNIIVYDHHITHADTQEAGGTVFGQQDGVTCFLGAVGANVSHLVQLLQKADINVLPEDATIALAGIYADTGNFTHANVSTEDFAAASWLIGQGAVVTLVKKFVSTWFDQELNAILHELLAKLQMLEVNGQIVLLGSISLEHQIAGLAMAVERIFELEHADAIFCVFGFPKEKSHLVIARSNGTGVDVAELLAHFGGGGHAASASALLRKSNDIPVMANLKTLLKNTVHQSVTATELMSPKVACVQESWSMLEAALFLEQHNHAGAPVLDASGNLSGMLGLKEIQKGRKALAMNAPVKAYMCRLPVQVGPQAALHDIETIFFNTDLGRLPVVLEGRVVGIISRSDLLGYLKRGTIPN